MLQDSAKLKKLASLLKQIYLCSVHVEYEIYINTYQLYSSLKYLLLSKLERIQEQLSYGC